MGTYTANYQLYMPTIGEQGWGELVNGNFTTIDTAMKGLSDRATALENVDITFNTRITKLEAGELSKLVLYDLKTTPGIGTLSITSSNDVTITAAVGNNVTVDINVSATSNHPYYEVGSVSGNMTVPFSWRVNNAGMSRFNVYADDVLVVDNASTNSSGSSSGKFNVPISLTLGTHTIKFVCVYTNSTARVFTIYALNNTQTLYL